MTTYGPIGIGEQGLKLKRGGEIPFVAHAPLALLAWQQALARLRICFVRGERCWRFTHKWKRCVPGSQAEPQITRWVQQ